MSSSDCPFCDVFEVNGTLSNNVWVQGGSSMTQILRCSVVAGTISDCTQGAFVLGPAP